MGIFGIMMTDAISHFIKYTLAKSGISAVTSKQLLDVFRAKIQGQRGRSELKRSHCPYLEAWPTKIRISSSHTT